MPSTGREPRRRPRRAVHIAAGCLRNARGEVLVCQRPAHKIYPGEWEFPGGKVERGERAREALARELREELGIRVEQARPLIRVRHDYPELAVDLDTWLVTGFRGEPRPTEHPALAWVAPGDLGGRALLAADRPIVTALRLPSDLVFSPPRATAAALRARLDRLPAGSLLRLRLPEARAREYARAAAELAGPCRERGLTLVVDRDPSAAGTLGAGGFHASAATARALAARPVPAGSWFGVSCHGAADLRRARALDADYAVLGPVRASPSHPGRRGLGWRAFARCAHGSGLPVFAIGGLGPADREAAWAHGAQGVAGIRAYWGVDFPGGGGASGGSSGIA